MARRLESLNFKTFSSQVKFSEGVTSICITDYSPSPSGENL